MLTRSRSALLGVLAGAALLAVAGTAYAFYYEGTDGPDSITVSSGGSVVWLLDGNDTFHGAKKGAGGNDHVYGGTGNDTLSSNASEDILRGQKGNDTLNGGAQPDGVYGGAGNDTLNGGGGIDVYKPGKGVDTCIGKRKDRRFPGRCEVVQILDD